MRKLLSQTKTSQTRRNSTLNGSGWALAFQARHRRAEPRVLRHVFGEKKWPSGKFKQKPERALNGPIITLGGKTMFETYLCHYPIQISSCFVSSGSMPEKIHTCLNKIGTKTAVVQACVDTISPEPKRLIILSKPQHFPDSASGSCARDLSEIVMSRTRPGAFSTFRPRILHGGSTAWRIIRSGDWEGPPGWSVDPSAEGAMTTARLLLSPITSPCPSFCHRSAVSVRVVTHSDRRSLTVRTFR